MTHATPTVPSGLTKLAAEIAGDGTPVVFLHAGVADRRMWREQLAALAQASGRYRPIAYDRRGFGDTLHAEEPFSQVGDLVAVLDHFAPRERVVLVGCSQGGRIAIDATLAHPKRIRALVLVAPAISGAPEVTAFPPPIQAWIDKVERAEAANDIDGLNALEAHAWLDGPLASDGRVTGAVRELFLDMNELALRSERRGTEIAPPTAYARVHDIEVPALVLWGELDFSHVAQNCEYLKAQLPKATAQCLRHAAHLPNLEHPAEFNRILLRFLEGVTR